LISNRFEKKDVIYRTSFAPGDDAPILRGKHPIIEEYEGMRVF
jgi:hypothetical protein